ncbi:OsmC family protein [Galbibacter sp.]|jgi:putative redox protein|uniref:OsmC family protein n=1 Tax=Galbibacter sp. TaxID=2918471 RepID=UPI003A8FB601
MAKITSIIENQAYKVVLTSKTGNTLIADEPQELGGQDLGFSPKELLAASLAACTSATLKMYAGRKNWDLQQVKISVELDYDASQHKTTIKRDLEFVGDLDSKQKDRLLQIANRCPVHKMLENTVHIDTQYKN